MSQILNFISLSIASFVGSNCFPQIISIMMTGCRWNNNKRIAFMRLRLALQKELHQSMPKMDIHDSVWAKGYQQFLVGK